MSARIADVALRFGLQHDKPAEFKLSRLDVPLGPGRIVFITGPSGSGKSTALDAIERQQPNAIVVDRMRFPGGRSVVDAVCAGAPLTDALATLSACGLSESPLWLRLPDELSDGQRFRARLARAVGWHARTTPTGPVICDEFCSGLHRRVAKALAFNLRKLATRRGLCLVLAASDDDFLSDLQPDAIVRLSATGHATTSEKQPRKRPISFARRLVVEPGKKADYDSFARMHYRATDELGFVDKVFVLRERCGGDLLGVVVYAYAPAELALRNRETRSRFSRRLDLLNRHVRILRRLVVHPDIRGCGLGHWLVRRTLPLVGTRYVECLASMGAVNPVFEKAGMTRIGTCARPDNLARALAQLDEWQIDPFACDFVTHVARRPRVRNLVARAVYQWYQATTGGGERRVARQSTEFLAQTFRGIVGSRPVYYLWERPSQARRKSAPTTPARRVKSAATRHSPEKRPSSRKTADRVHAPSPRRAKRRTRV